MSADTPDIDPVTGVETTGHEWDGIKELNKPLPRWWVWTFYATIVWAVGYWIVYPAWPTSNGYSKGIFGYSQRDVVAKDLAAAQSAQTAYRDKLKATPLADIPFDPELYRFAISAGSAAFQNNCAPCHGRGAQGSIGYPNLNDDDWLWGGSLEEIERTIMVGIRGDDKETRATQMPRFGLDQLLSEKEIADVVEYVLSLSGKSQALDAIARAKRRLPINVPRVTAATARARPSWEPPI